MALSSANLSPSEVDQIVRIALAEDIGGRDRTTEGAVPAEAMCRAEIRLEETGIVCGVDLAAAVFKALDDSLEVDLIIRDRAHVSEPPAPVVAIEGHARPVLTGERVALNLLGRLSGIATLTRRYVEAIDGTGATILDTRKTTPGLRALEKYAVRCGGATNHRASLDEAILLKENHIRLAGGLTEAVRAVRDASPGSPLEVEAETLGDVREAIDAGADRVLLDNMSPAEVMAAVDLADGRTELEASGGITLENVREYAETGVQYISVGALTHSARSLDVSLEVLT